MTSNSTKAFELLQKVGLSALVEFDGCACAEFSICGITVDIHCWRTRRDDCACDGIGIHVMGMSGMDEITEVDRLGLQVIATFVATELKQFWPCSTPATVVSIC